MHFGRVFVAQFAQQKFVIHKIGDALNIGEKQFEGNTWLLADPERLWERGLLKEACFFAVILQFVNFLRGHLLQREHQFRACLRPGCPGHNQTDVQNRHAEGKPWQLREPIGPFLLTNADERIVVALHCLFAHRINTFKLTVDGANAKQMLTKLGNCFLGCRI